MEKKCPQCKQIKEYACFNRAKYEKDGRRKECRECRKKYYRKPKEIVDAWNIKRKEHAKKLGLASKGTKRTPEQCERYKEGKRRKFENYDYEPAYIKRVLNRYKKFGLKMDFEEFKSIIKSSCHYCGVEPVKKDCATYYRSNGHQNFHYNGIDRVDNDKGYEIENCVPCCTRCNIAKHNMKVCEFMDLVKKIYENNFVKNHKLGAVTIGN